MNPLASLLPATDPADVPAWGALAAGCVQLSILSVSFQAPKLLRWKEELAPLPKLHRQMHWVYAGYVVLCIIAFGLISILLPTEVAHGSPLARAFCGFVAVFWAIRLALQWVFDLRPYADTPIRRLGARMLTVAFALLALGYGALALCPRG